MVENQIFCVGLSKNSGWPSIGVNIDNTLIDLWRTFANPGTTHCFGIYPNGVVVIAVQNDWSIRRDLI
ncbi:unannotated protein [freshwater metagenome]|uniref:Unannotated protein n=1 Tax=freshwater metagenome TaxID=449393 RepID=A0A6J6AWQ9_9ZZZZ